MELGGHDMPGPAAGAMTTVAFVPLIATNVVTLTLQLAIFWLKWRFGRTPPRARAEPWEEHL